MRKHARWLILVLIAAFILIETSKLRGPDPPAPDNLSNVDPDVAKLIKQTISHVRQKKSDLSRWARLGKTYEAYAMHALASECYEHILDKDANQGKIWFRQAICTERLGDLDAAVTAMDRAIELEPDFAAARWRQAMWLVEVGDQEKARRRAEEAVELGADDPSSWFAKAQVLIADKQNEEAIEIINGHNLTQDRNGNFANYLLGTAYRQLGDLQQAAPFLSQSKNFKPNWQDPWTAELAKYHTGISKLKGVASNMVRAGRFQDAIPLLEKVIAAEPTESRALNLLGVSYMQVGKFDKCFATLESSLSANPDDFSSHVNYAAGVAMAAQYGKGDIGLGLQRAERAIELRPDVAAPHEASGRLLSQLGRFEDAIIAFDKAYELDARVPTRAIEAANIALKLGNKEDAMQRVEALQSAHPDSAAVMIALAIVQLEMKDVVTARQSAEAAMRAKSSSPLDKKRAEAVLKQIDSLATEAKAP